MANKRFIVRHGLDNSGDNSVVNTITNVAEPVNNSDAATKYYVDTHTTGGTVTSVTATSPVESTGGTAPVISLGTGANGQLVIGTGTGFTKSTLTAGSGVSIANASGSITISATGSGGDVVGPASATDNAVTRFDSTTGKLIQNSTVTLDDNGNFGNVNSVVLDNTPATLPTGAGTMYWEDGEGTAEVILKGGNTTLKVGTQEYARVYNDSGSTITLGQVVYISGAQGNRIAVKLAQANTEANSFGTLGLVAETIANGAEGWIIVSGALYKLNTNGLTAGAVVYLSPTTAGAYTTTKPQAPDQLVVLGFIERVSSTVGSIYVKVDNGYELDELHDVRITSPVSGNTLIYDATTSPTGVWKNASLTAGTGISVTNGAGSITIGNTGVTSVSGTSPVVSSGGATPAISLASGYGDTQNPYGSKTANYFLASPNGSAGVPTWRSIVAADIPTLNQNTTGNAATASALQTARNINGVSFNGTADITVTAAASTLTGTTLASGVTASSLTSVGTLTGLTVSGTTSLATSSGYSQIGTTSNYTSSKLQVYGNIDLVNTSTSQYIRFYDGTTFNGGLGTDNWVGGSSANLTLVSNGDTVFRTTGSATERMRIVGSSGNVGIGTSSPSAKLDVNGQVRAAYASGFQVDNAGTMLGKLYYSGGLILDRAASTSLFIAQNGSNQVTLDSSGNLGIGVTPSAWTTNKAIQIGIYGAIEDNSGGGGGIALFGNSYEYASGAYKYLQNYYATLYRTYAGQHQWFNAPSGTAGNAITFTQAMTLDSSGNLGIGTTSPAANLSVSGSSNTGIRIKGGSSALSYIDFDEADSGTPNGSIAYVHASNYMTFATGGSNAERMRITSGGDVGIGTSSPDGKLEVSGKLKVRGTTSANDLVQVWGVSGGSGSYTTLELIKTADTSGNFIFRGFTAGGTGTAPKIAFGNWSATPFDGAQMTLDTSSGNVGIGTSSPTNKLQVNGVMVGNNASGSYTKGFGGILTTTSTSTPTGGSSGDFALIY